MHPGWGVAGTLASIVALPLSVWFYLKTVPSRELAVVEPSVRAVFLDRLAPPVLDVRVRDAQVTGADVFAVQFALWNRGNQPIRPENVLEAVRFVPDDHATVADCSVLRSTRDLCRLQVTRSSDGKTADVTWGILEPGDGALVQLVLVGDRDCRVGIAGALEGSGRPSFVRIRTADPNPAQKPAWSVRGGFPISLGAIGFGLFCLLMFMAVTVDLRKEWGALTSERRYAIIALRLVLATLGLCFGLLTFAAFAWELATELRVPPSLLQRP